MELKIGDVVRLKSGGPEMTVKQYPFKTVDGREHPDIADCEWFTVEGKLIHNAFNINELEMI